MKRALLLLLLLMVFSGVIAYDFETERNHALWTQIQEQDYGALYLNYMEKDPILDRAPLYGEESAPITVILYVDNSESSKRLIEDVLPWLQSNLVQEGTVRIYEKHAVRDSGDMVFANMHDCLLAHDPDYMKRHHELFAIPLEQALKIAGEYEKDNCSYAKDDENEVRRLRLGAMMPLIIIGIDGDDTMKITGVPSIDRLETVLLRYETRIGEI